MLHELKIWPEYFDMVDAGRKTFEIRRDDRGYQSGDILYLREYDPVEQAYTGRALCRRVTYMTAYAQRGGYVVMALGDVVPGKAAEQTVS
ncbi:hypothetical protein EXIGUO8H_430005 [Exiguobacterium sp. 8H]|uniref:ASCH/PUA domain-containing protein n=1 Tax=unclassified Exiguobacterium TaxID=2644629 RepID=UPI0012EEE8CE